MNQPIQDHLKVGGLAAANVSLASADHFFQSLEPMLRSGLLVVQIIAAIVTIVYVIGKIRKPRK